MAITKTSFINYSRCPRFVALDDVKKEKLDSMITYDEYKKEENENLLTELLEIMYDENGIDNIDTRNEHLEIMMPYYNMVEILAGKLAPKYFDGTFKYAKNTKMQESFDCKINGIRYLCYVDIYNETKDGFNIIEVKATTTKKYLDLKVKVDGKYEPIFRKNEEGIYCLLEDLNINIEDIMNIKKYNNQRSKLFDKLTSVGHYIYDIAVQRYIIENDLKQNKNTVNKVKYYLAVLNSEYIYDGKVLDGEPVYDTDKNGNEIISFVDVTSITKEYMDKIDFDRRLIEKYIVDLNANACPIGNHCEINKTTKCKYSKICWDFVPKTNSILNYFDSHFGFNGKDRYELINEGYIDMLDIKEDMLTREKNKIQRRTYETKKEYINKEKIKAGIETIKYPIYHLDFETFPCPLPRYRGEKCYTQSVFQFSLHVEKEKGICDKEKDHYEYLAIDHQDRREELIKKMCEYIKDEGTVLVYNDSFEKTRLKELASIFPEYSQKLLKIRDMVFDLMNIVKTNTKFYQNLGYDENEAKMFNFYDYRMSGSFSIKKVLPLFSDLTYKDMEIGNGVEAMVAYATFPKLGKKEYEHKYNKLVEYCKQDTWAMYMVLEGLRKCVK